MCNCRNHGERCALDRSDFNFYVPDESHGSHRPRRPWIPPVHRGVLWKITSKKRFTGASEGKIDKKTTKNQKIQQRRQHKLKKMIFGDFVSQLYKW